MLAGYDTCVVAQCFPLSIIEHISLVWGSGRTLSKCYQVTSSNQTETSHSIQASMSTVLYVMVISWVRGMYGIYFIEVRRHKVTQVPGGMIKIVEFRI